MSDPQQEQSRQRARIILQVRSGQISAKEGAAQLGISRKTYYEWEGRALEAMAAAMEDRQSGRPGLPQDAEKAELVKENTELKEQLFLAKKTIEVKELLAAYEKQQSLDIKKKGSSGRRH